MEPSDHVPFVDDVRELANQCLNRHYLMTGRDLQSDTPHADREALNLIRAGLPSPFGRRNCAAGKCWRSILRNY